MEKYYSFLPSDIDIETDGEQTQRAKNLLENAYILKTSESLLICESEEHQAHIPEIEDNSLVSWVLTAPGYQTYEIEKASATLKYGYDDNKKPTVTFGFVPRHTNEHKSKFITRKVTYNLGTHLFRFEGPIDVYEFPAFIDSVLSNLESSLAIGEMDVHSFVTPS